MNFDAYEYLARITISSFARTVDASISDSLCAAIGGPLRPPSVWSLSIGAPSPMAIQGEIGQVGNLPVEVLAWNVHARPCVDCGCITGRFCDFCYAVDRIPTDE